MTMDSSQSRKHHITINNPERYGYTKEIIIEKLKLLGLDYFCFAYEISDTGTPHWHIYTYSKSAKRFRTIVNTFEKAHVEPARGTHVENRNYIRKEGEKYLEKKKTNVIDSFVESGEIPKERVPAIDKKEKLYSMITDGYSLEQILDEDQEYIYRTRNIQELIQIRDAQKYYTDERGVEVIYLHGSTKTGKSSSIREKHGIENIFTVTNYRSSNQGVYFDNYKAQDVILMDNYSSQIPIETMMSLMEKPQYLPARFFDRVSCYTKLYIVSLLPLEHQYLEIQHEEFEIWNAFASKIDKVIEFKTGTNNKLD